MSIVQLHKPSSMHAASQFAEPGLALRVGVSPPVRVMETQSSNASTASHERTGRTVRLFGFDVFDTTLVAAAQWIVQRALAELPTKIAFVNAHCVNVMYRNSSYRDTVEGCDRLFADGIGMRLAARTAGVRLHANVNGTDLFPLLCAEAARTGAKIYLLGGRNGVSNIAARRMARQYPDLAIVGSDTGHFENEKNEQRAIAAINASGAQIVLVGLGVPHQELWIARNRNKLAPSVLIAVGGLFDYFSGRVPRAPGFLRHHGCEWIWRLAMEPRRLAHRYLVGNIIFLSRLILLKLVTPAEFDQGQVAHR